jgi:hypothetical protein
MWWQLTGLPDPPWVWQVMKPSECGRHAAVSVRAAVHRPVGVPRVNAAVGLDHVRYKWAVEVQSSTHQHQPVQLRHAAQGGRQRNGALVPDGVLAQVQAGQAGVGLCMGKGELGHGGELELMVPLPAWQGRCNWATSTISHLPPHHPTPAELRAPSFSRKWPQLLTHLESRQQVVTAHG